MEIDTPPKQLHKHALPIIMMSLAVIVLSAAAMLNGYTTGQPNAVARGLVTQVVHIKPAHNGLVKFTLSTAPSPAPAGASLQSFTPGR